jgi:hypothetical protein
MSTLCFVSADGMNRGELSFSESLKPYPGKTFRFADNTFIFLWLKTGMYYGIYVINHEKFDEMRKENRGKCRIAAYLNPAIRRAFGWGSAPCGCCTPQAD